MYSKDVQVELAGIAGCPACPTTGASDVLYQEVRTLAEAGVSVIHVSSCIMTLCAFREKQLKPLQARFPGITFVSGTHDIKSDDFWDKMKHFSSQPRSRSVTIAEQSA
jgi:predicted metal-binding protein